MDMNAVRLNTAFKVRLGIALIGAIFLFGALVFWPAGRLDWVRGWLYLGVVTVFYLVNLLYLAKVNPGLIEARMRFGEGTKRWDKILGILISPLFLAIYVVAGFDAIRFEWSVMPPEFWLLGLAIFLPGMALFVWAMSVNPFFEKTVRIQTDRGHHVIDSGPYGYVRHPGYLGFLGWGLSVPFFLGSWWALLPAVLSVIGIVVRTALEDRTLRRELTGYEDYASRVRYRLLPGIW